MQIVTTSVKNVKSAIFMLTVIARITYSESKELREYLGLHVTEYYTMQ
jgi:hypothetical protein